MKTILHIIDTTGPGGAETVFIDLSSRLPQDKYRAIVLIRGKGWVYDELLRRGIEPVILDAKGSFNWRFLFRLCRLILSEKVDLIQAHLLGSCVYASLAGLITRRPVVSTFHGSVDIGENERLKWLKFGAINLSHGKVISVSENLKKDIINRSPVRPDKVMVIYNGIACHEFNRPKCNRLKSQNGWGPESIIVGSLGNIRPAKAYDVLIQAAALCKRNNAPFKFVIAGQGKGRLYDELLTLIKENELVDDVQFVGFQDDPAEFLSNLDIFLLSSSSEGFSIATIQAMANQLPVVATKSGGPEEILVDNKTGLLIEINKPEAIADSLEKLRKNPELMQQLSTSGLNHVIKNFDITVMLDSYQKIYSNCLA